MRLKILIGKPKENALFVRDRNRLVDDIKINLENWVLKMRLDWIVHGLVQR
jgi:hypothetical protein